jgi:ribosomal protein L19E
MVDASDTFFSDYKVDPSRKADLLVKAAQELSPTLMEKLNARIAGFEKKAGKKAAKNTPETSKAGADDEDSDEEVSSAVVISEKALDAFWEELEKMDVSTLIGDDVIRAFEYQGFNPNKLLQTIMKRGMDAKKDKNQILKDIVDMVTIAIIKGSITEKNLGKMSDTGKLTYQKFESVYKLVKGGSKGKESDHVTVARVAATMPGVVMNVLKQKPGLTKQFAGPFGSSALPYYLRHQAAAACIPQNSPPRLIEFLLGLITAFTADQSKVLSQSKTGADELFDKQSNFVTTTYSSAHPVEASRVKIFKSFSLESDYEKISVVAAKIKKVKTDFVVLTIEQIAEDLAK